MTDQEDAATDLELPTDFSSEAESDSSSEAAPPSQARCTESSDSDDNDEMPSLEDDDRGTIAPAARADMAPEEPETVLEDNETARAPAPEAAGLGSDFAAYILGEAFFVGKYNLPKDPVRARFWIKKVVDGECEHKHLASKLMANSVEMLRELDG